MTDHDDHDHSRTFQPDHPEPTSDAALVGLALRELMIEAGHYTAEEELAVIAKMQGASPENGGKIVARAWTRTPITNNDCWIMARNRSGNSASNSNHTNSR